MADILFLGHRIPYPPNKGDKIRSWNFLAHLAAHHRVHLGCFIDDPADWDHVATLLDICQETNFVQLPRSPLRPGNAGALLDGMPITIRHFRRAAMRRWVADICTRRPIDAVFVFSSAMAQYLNAQAARALPAVVDFVDVDSDKWRQYAERKSGPGGWIYRRESRALLAFERETAVRTARSVFVSDNEAALFRSLAPETAGKVMAIPNGVDTVFFDPAQDFASPFAPGDTALVFTGAMDYWANVDAVTWFAETVLPAVRRTRPKVRFWIVGANPDPAVQRLAERPGIVVTGRVPDTRPYLAHAALVVAPLRIARGTQNKVLEAMAMGRPVLTTPAAAAGAEACVAGTDLVVTDTADAWAAVIGSLLADTAGTGALGRHARQRVLASYGWQSSFDRLDRVLDVAGNGGDGP
ncbi:MAG: TIGR03087 family PEP-CTERM/XrtA system glycosyltransferase [Alphaproteobacteria bacterium]|jgi:sugar transferase (PEP-CTERM/EpsH1 system associated)|nr:TIGR03087 family PEP-CTERM/XrtA system glycosyltransferase [Alphaproteobacteria bacterium]